MTYRKTVAVLGFVFVVGLGLSVQGAAAEPARDAIQRILDLLESYGDVTRSWSRVLPSNERFVVLPAFNNEAVLDRNTGLVWQRTPSRDSRFWFSAQYACLNARIGGQMGWRMPSISEMTSLLDVSRNNPALPAGAPFDIDGLAFFWSATRRAGFTDLAWGVNVRDGDVDDYEAFLTVHAWCVRGGVNSDEH